MLGLLRNKKAQNTAEYAILIGVIVAAAIAMQTYVKRGLQGRVKEAVDHVGSGGTVGDNRLTFSGGQYEPYYLQTDFTNTESNTETEDTVLGGRVTRTTQRTTSRSGTQQYTAAQ
jgi:Flp pilus assembly pilin Flp